MAWLKSRTAGATGRLFLNILSIYHGMYGRASAVLFFFAPLCALTVRRSRIHTAALWVAPLLPPVRKCTEHMAGKQAGQGEPSEADIVRRLRALRDRLGMTQEVLATRSHLSRSTIGKIDSGIRKVTATPLRASLAKGYGLALDVFEQYLAGSLSLDEVSARSTAQPQYLAEQLEPSDVTDDLDERLQYALERAFKGSPYGLAALDTVRQSVADLATTRTSRLLMDDDVIARLMPQLLAAADEAGRIWGTGPVPLVDLLMRVAVTLNDELAAQAEGVSVEEILARRRAKEQEAVLARDAGKLNLLRKLIKGGFEGEVAKRVGMTPEALYETLEGPDVTTFYYRKAVSRAEAVWDALEAELAKRHHEKSVLGTDVDDDIMDDPDIPT